MPASTVSHRIQGGPQAHHFCGACVQYVFATWSHAILATMVTVRFRDHGHGMLLRPWSQYASATMVTVCFCDHGHGIVFATMVMVRLCDHGRSMACDHGHGMGCDHGRGRVCDQGHGRYCDHGRGIRFFPQIILKRVRESKTLYCDHISRPWSQYGLRPWSRYGFSTCKTQA
jgi:hypothetical protein